MDHYAQAFRLAAIALSNGAISDEIKSKTLAAAQAAGVTITQYLHAVSILKAGAPELVALEEGDFGSNVATMSFKDKGRTFLRKIRP